MGTHRALAVWITASALGVALILMLPEDLLGEGALFRLSKRHGPGAADLVGIAFLFAGWAIYVRELWLGRHLLRHRRMALALCLSALAATAICLAAIMADRDVAAVLAGFWAIAAQIAMGCLPHCHRPRHWE